MCAQFLAQGVAIDAEHIGGFALIATDKFHHADQERTFCFTKNALVQTGGCLVAIDCGEIVAQVAVNAFRDGFGGGGRSLAWACEVGLG